jgi:predicted Ser/Thr protein kinase
MTITGPFVLKEDVVLIPCAELSDDVRARISFDQGDYTIMHRHGRAPMQVIDAGTAALLALFRQPRTIADAVLENSRAIGTLPDTRLDELLPHLDAFLDGRVLVPAGSGEEIAIRPRYDSGTAVAGWTIVRCIHLIEDKEIYEVRNGHGGAVLKIGRNDTPELQWRFENEAAILRRLHGSAVAPELIGAGTLDGRPYLTAEWISGVDISVAAADRRHDRTALVDLCASVARAYATLHVRGVVHGDVNWRNIMAGDRLVLLDFEAARLAGEPARIGRMVMPLFAEPECASAMRHGSTLPPSEAGEQYAVAALLYLLLTGQHYLEFRYEHDEMLRQVESDSPLPFAARGLPPWPEIEAILGRALEKDPSGRYGSIAEMAALLEAAREDAARASLATPLSSEATALLETTLQSFARGGAMFRSGYPIAPTASINYGCAGAAVGLLRMAEARGEPALLALADVWRSRAAALSATEEAFYNADAELGCERLGNVTPYHTEAGIHAAAAMIFTSMGDLEAQQRSIAAFLHASRKPCSEIDLTLGRSGSLLAAAMLLTTGDGLSETEALRAFGTETMGAIWRELDERPAIADSPGAVLSLAHGWAGYLYASLRWCAASGDPLPPHLVDRLREFTELKIPHRRGLCWPTYAGNEAYWPLVASWCNGSAGHLFLFTLAHRLLGGDEWLRLAEGCAWTSWDAACATIDLCCGGAGRAYALLNLYKHTGEAEWLGRARQLANHAAAPAAPAARHNALWKGELGVAVLIADLSSPENARMPFFE